MIRARPIFWGVVLAAMFLAAVLSGPPTPRLFGLAVDADDVQALCRKPACSLKDFGPAPKRSGFSP